MHRKSRLLIMTAAWLFMLGSRGLWASSPIEQVKATVDRVVEVLKDSRFQGESKRSGRREEIRRVVFSRFDMGEMAKRSLGHHWQRYQGRQQEFVPAFRGLMENSFVNQIESFRDEKIVYTRERIEGLFAEVETRVALSNGNEVPINYRLHQSGGQWKVYDVLIENVSLVGNYRSQFHRILSAASFDDLLRILQEKGSEGRPKETKLVRIRS